MNIGELLQELRENILRDRSDIIAGDSDSMWSDETLLRYIKDAERRFARQTLMLRDSTTAEVVRVVLRNGAPDYALHQSVIAVVSGRYDADTYDLPRSGHAILLQITPPDFLMFDPADAFTLPPGRPSAFYTDETLVFARQSRVTLTVYPTPSATEDGKILHLRVVRLPLTRYTLDNLDACSEIPEDYQFDTLEWAAYRAQRAFDADAGAATTSEAHKAAFMEAVKNAARETRRKMFVNTRIRYGANGFAWVR